MNRAIKIIAGLSIARLACMPSHADQYAWQTDMDVGKDAFLKHNYSLAIKSYSLAVAEAELPGSENLRLTKSLDGLAVAYSRLYYFSAAEQLYQRSLAIKERLLGPNHLDVADTLSGLGSLRVWQGIVAKESASKFFDEAEKFYKRALQIRQNPPAYDRVHAADSLIDLGKLYTTQAFRLPDDPSSLTASGAGKTKKQRFEDAESCFTQALAIREKALDSSDRELAEILLLLGEARVNEGKLAEASPLIERAISIWESKVGRDDPEQTAEFCSAAVSLNNLAVRYINKGRYEAAGRILDEAIRLNPNYQLGYKNRSIVRTKLGNTTGAESDTKTYNRLGP